MIRLFFNRLNLWSLLNNRREGSEVTRYEVNHTSELEFHVLVFVGFCGISNAVVQTFLGGRVIRYFGPRHVFTVAFWALMFVFSAYPLLTFLARRLGIFFELIQMPVQRLAESEDYAVSVWDVWMSGDMGNSNSSRGISIISSP
ncbi:hypothetical protein B0H13DRAFT_447645 [Mycena leptocephala]|nr:hypothetical protein B0H13DRAFT_447645 [Mycena leptocephala]